MYIGCKGSAEMTAQPSRQSGTSLNPSVDAAPYPLPPPLRRFSLGTLVSPLLKNQHFQILIQS